MKPGEVRDKSDAELKKLAVELEEEVFRLKFRKGSGELKQPTNIKKTRRVLARVKTVQRERVIKESMEAKKA